MYESHNIANSIKQIAQEKNIVIKNMLLELELGSNTMSSMYHGKMIASDRLARIADYLDCSVDYLLGRADSSASSPAISESSDCQGQSDKNLLNVVIEDFSTPPNEAKKAPSLEDRDEELLNQYHILDAMDRGFIRGEISVLLRQEKYRKETDSLKEA